jgi:hypothetical protein
MSSDLGVEGNIVVELERSPIFPLVPVSSHRAIDKVTVNEFVTAILSFGFLIISPIGETAFGW